MTARLLQALSIEPTVEPTLCVKPDPRGLGGLLAGDAALPLTACRVRAEVMGGLARTTVVQTYKNTRVQGMEAVHIFPLPDRGAVVSVVLSAGEVRVVAECRERAEAEAAFAEARREGHRAALLTQEREDVHTLRVTNLPPKTSVQVEIVVEEALEVVDGRVQYRFPTTIAPRYTPGDALGHIGPGVSPDTDIVMDASRLTPPMRLQGGTLLDLEVVVRGTVRRVSSSLHAVSMTLDDGAVRVAPSQQATLDRDFVLAVTFGDAEQSGARAWTDGAHTLLVLEPPADAMPPALPRDAVVVVDISGSMRGRKMDAAKLALKTVLHGLMPQDRFLVIAFDDRVEMFCERFLPVDDDTLARADRWVDALRPRGGTVMAPALEQALSTEVTPEGRQRTVLFVTDGQSTDEERLMQLLWQRKGTARVFPLGIDTAVNSALLRRMARIGGGVCELTEPTADIEAVVARHEARFGAPLVEGVRIEGGVPSQSPLPALFLGRPATILLEGGARELTVHGTAHTGAWSVTVSADPAPFALGPAWARSRVAALEDRLIVKPFEEDALRPEILRVALAHGVVSRCTAFVAVDTSVTVDGKPVEVVQPVEHPAWSGGGHRPVLPVGAPMFMNAMAGALPPPMAMATGAPPPPAPRARSARRARRASAPQPRGGLLARLRSAVSGKSTVDRFGGSDPVPEAPMPEAEDLDFAPAMETEEDTGAMHFSMPAPQQPPGADASSDDPGAIARRQSADGSFGGSLDETLRCLIVLVRVGHTRRVGARRRVVQKAAAWLSRQPDDERIDAALALLDQLERGAAVPDAEWDRLVGLLDDRASRLQ